jgi:FtsP/CotA-like multicopper oxidase with cupredoxin domain
VTQQQTLTVGGRSISGFTVNGTSPGPEIRAMQGQLIEVHLRNESVADGITLHWHGIDVPNAMDGVAGVTQDAVPVGGEFTYRFVLGRPARTGITPTRSPTLRWSEDCSVHLW